MTKRDPFGRCGICGRTKNEDCCGHCHRGVNRHYGRFGFYARPEQRAYQQFRRGRYIYDDQYQGADRD